MITELRGTIGQQAAETRGQLADLAADLRQGGAVFSRRQPAAACGELSKSVATWQRGFPCAHYSRKRPRLLSHT